MDHWFDRLTKRLAQGTVSRREMLGSTIKASLVAIAAPLLSRSEAFAQMVSAEIEGQPRADFCEGHREGRTLILNLSASSTFAGKQLTYNQTTRKISRKGNTEINKTIKLGGSTLLQVEADKRANSTRVTVRYGEGFQGIRQATFSSTDGKVLQGEVDGHRLSPFRIGSDPSSMKFADGSPSPTVKISTQTADALKSIQERAKQVAASCSARRAVLPPPSVRLASSGEPADLTLLDADRRPFSLKLGAHD